ncbi:hypothetical protein CDLVIII_2915 [Clostridium sp. DL-VIII]|uniref:C39 family peptidase n=1 Tax=Clostridium sp. DL-VIII TaxID=641107 RepID=UPI00023AFC39|nr:C39 family peptidase [Clostridium sp. DL-VIII]EHI99507.1 hypothetical protein CDLVIII_2915 [Clostridium sp. DL-VIII]
MSFNIEILNFLKYVIITIFWIIVIDALIMSVPILQLKKRREIPLKFSINMKNRIDFQHGNKCAAFATAYVLRHFNINSDGNTLYQHFPCKVPGGVTPLGIRIVLRKHNLKTKYKKGSIYNLKEDLNNGAPVIVFIHPSPNSKGSHFVPVTGYDEDGFYMAESIEKLSNITNEKGICNRKVNYKDFKIMWNIKNIYMPLYSNTYIVVSPKKDKS